MPAHRELVRTWSSGDASLAAWSEYYQHSASLCEQIAEIDPAHELEALYWARREHIARSRSRPGRRRAATKVATVGDHEKLTRYGATRHTGNTLAGETGGRCAKDGAHGTPHNAAAGWEEAEAGPTAVVSSLGYLGV